MARLERSALHRLVPGCYPDGTELYRFFRIRHHQLDRRRSAPSAMVIVQR